MTPLETMVTKTQKHQLRLDNYSSGFHIRKDLVVLILIKRTSIALIKFKLCSGKQNYNIVCDHPIIFRTKNVNPSRVAQGGGCNTLLL